MAEQKKESFWQTYKYDIYKIALLVFLIWVFGVPIAKEGESVRVYSFYYWSFVGLVTFIVISPKVLLFLLEKLDGKYDKDFAKAQSSGCDSFSRETQEKVWDLINNLFNLQEAVFDKNPFISWSDRRRAKKAVRAAIAALHLEMTRLILIGKQNPWKNLPQEKQNELFNSRNEKIEAMNAATKEAQNAFIELTSRGSIDAQATEMFRQKFDILTHKALLMNGVAPQSQQLQRPLDINFQGFKRLPAVKKDAPQDIELSYRITSKDNKTLWRFFAPRRAQFKELIENTVSYCTDGELVVKEVAITQGSIQIIIVLTVASLTVATTSIYYNKERLETAIQELSNKLLASFEQFFREFLNIVAAVGRIKAALRRLLFFWNKEERS